MRQQLQSYRFFTFCFAFFVFFFSTTFAFAYQLPQDQKPVKKHSHYSAVPRTNLSSYVCPGDPEVFCVEEREGVAVDVGRTSYNDIGTDVLHDSGALLFARQIVRNYLLEEETSQKTTTSQ